MHKTYEKTRERPTKWLLSAAALASLAACGGSSSDGAKVAALEAWVTCASEGGTCAVPGSRVVRYGANGTYYYQSVDGSVSCTNGTWGGDPAIGVTKQCEYADAAAVTTAPSTTSGTAADTTTAPASEVVAQEPPATTSTADTSPPATTSTPAATTPVASTPASSTPAAAAAPTTTTSTSSDFSPSGYQLVLADEFDGSSLDRSKWCTRYVYGGGAALQVPDSQCTPNGGGTLDFLNDEQQRYRDFNARGETMHVVSNGTLKLRATKTGSGYAAYESSMIRSKLEFKPSSSVSYYITARVKLPNVLGTWPAQWLAGGFGTNNQIQWPPEIDILEAPTNNVGQPANTIRMGSQVQGLQTSSRSYEFTASVPEYDRQWQNYKPSRSLRDVWLEVGALWAANSVCYFVDGQRVACENYNWADNNGTAANPAHLLINLAIGGAWAGASGIEDAKFPTQMELDHVRIYRSGG